MNIERMRRAVALWSSIPASEWNLDRYEAVLGSRACCALGHLGARNFEGLEMVADPYTGTNMVPMWKYFAGIDAGAKFFDIPYSHALLLFKSRIGTHERCGLPAELMDKRIFFSQLRRTCKLLGVDPNTLFKVVDAAPGDALPSSDAERYQQAKQAPHTSLLKRLMSRFAEPTL